MIRVWYSNYLEELVEALAGNLEALAAEGAIDPFDTTTIIVPNRNIASFLKFSLAQRLGVVANVRFEYLYAFFRGAAESSGVRIVGKQGLQTILVDVLGDQEVLSIPELASVRGYLEAGRGPDDRDRRRFQLAGELAQVFEEYALSRPRMLSFWPSKTILEAQPFASTEVWQRVLWLEVFGEGGRLERLRDDSGHPIVLISDVMRELGPGALELPAQLHVFGLSYVARSFYQLFAELAQSAHVLVYTLNPCMEYWEDVPAGFRLGHRHRFERRSQEQSSLFVEEDAEAMAPAALRAWGKPGRDNVHLLNMLTECDFAGRFVDPLEDGDTVLHRLQRDTLVRRPPSEAPKRTYDDDSIRFISAHNIQREVEAVANEILDLKRHYAERGESLRFNEIAVIVNNAERESYQARIRAVFQSAHQIPHNIIDITASAHRKFLEAIDLLLALPFGSFKRRELLRLLTHDNVLARTREVSAEDWIRWCKALNILHGADHQDHAGTYIEDDLYNWDQGLLRLTLGAFMAAEPAGVEGPVVVGGRELLPLELASQEVDSAAQLVTYARSLINDARWLASTQMKMTEWTEVIAELIGAYLAPSNDEDEYDRVRCLRRLQEIADEDLSREPVSYRIAFEAVRRALAGLEISRGQYLAEGVVISSFLPMRPIPFKVVFVTGLGEKHFPRSDVWSPLDLRWAPEQEHARGSLVSVRAQDEYMFLETLISTRDRLYLSHVGHDAQTGEELEPSSVVRQLQFMLRQEYMDDEALARRDVAHPLRRWDEAYFEDGRLPSYLPQAGGEAAMRSLRDDLEEYRERHGKPPLPTIAELRAGAAADVSGPLGQSLGLREIPDRDLAVGDDVSVALWQIRKFLESPSQGAAQFYLRMREDEWDDPFGVEDEVFEAQALHSVPLQRDTFLACLSEFGLDFGPAELRSHHVDRFRKAVLDGYAPTGPFGEAAIGKQVRQMEGWLANLRRAKIDPAIATKRLGAGRPAESLLVAPLEIAGPDGRRVSVTLVGETGLVGEREATSIVLSASKSPGRGGDAERAFLRGFLDQAVCSAAGLRADEAWRVVIATAAIPRRAEDAERRFAAFGTDEARAWLSGVVADMLAGMPTYFLPVEAVFEHKYGRKRRTLSRCIEMEREQYDWRSFKSGPVHEPQALFDAPADAEAIVARRFGPYFQRRTAQ